MKSINLTNACQVPVVIISAIACPRILVVYALLKNLFQNVSEERHLLLGQKVYVD